MIDLAEGGRDEIARNLHRQTRYLFRDLVRLRLASGYTFFDMADAIGTDVAHVLDFGRNVAAADPSWDFVLRYAHAIGVDLVLKVKDDDD